MRFPIDGYTYRLRDIFLRFNRLKIAILPIVDYIVDPQQRNAQQYQHNLYIAEKYIQWATILSLIMRVCLHSFSHCWLPNLGNHAKFRENSNLQQFKVIKGNRPWSQSKAHNATSYQSLMVTLNLSRTVFETLTHKSRKQLVFRTTPLFDARSGNRQNFLMKLIPQKLEGWGCCTVKIA